MVKVHKHCLPIISTCPYLMYHLSILIELVDLGEISLIQVKINFNLLDLNRLCFKRIYRGQNLSYFQQYIFHLFCSHFSLVEIYSIELNCKLFNKNLDLSDLRFIIFFEFTQALVLFGLWFIHFALEDVNRVQGFNFLGVVHFDIVHFVLCHQINE